MHRTTPRFRYCYSVLPVSVQKLAKKNYHLLSKNPRHPSLHFKKIGQLWSIRVGIAHRALAVKDGSDFIWVWIGTHDEYTRLYQQK